MQSPPNEGWVIYMLECQDKTLYTGITNCFLDRFNKHNAGLGARYTRARLPVRMVYFELANNKSEALKREYAIKQLPRGEKLKLVEN